MFNRLSTVVKSQGILANKPFCFTKNMKIPSIYSNFQSYHTQPAVFTTKKFFSNNYTEKDLQIYKKTEDMEKFKKLLFMTSGIGGLASILTLSAFIKGHLLISAAFAFFAVKNLHTTNKNYKRGNSFSQKIVLSNDLTKARFYYGINMQMKNIAISDIKKGKVIEVPIDNQEKARRLFVEVHLEDVMLFVILQEKDTFIKDRKQLNALVEGNQSEVARLFNNPEDDSEFNEFMDIHKDQMNQDKDN